MKKERSKFDKFVEKILAILAILSWLGMAGLIIWGQIQGGYKVIMIIYIVTTTYMYYLDNVKYSDSREGRE